MSIRHRIRRGGGASVLAAAVGAVALAGCGSSSVSNVLDPVARAATISTSSAGYRMNIAMSITNPALATPITATGQGAFDVPDHSGVLTMGLDFGDSPQIAAVLGGGTLQLEELIHGPIFYIKLPATITSKVPMLGSKPWIEVNLAQAASSAGASGLASLLENPTSENPSEFLTYLRAAAGNVTKVGTAQVDGFQTTEYRATIDMSRIPDAVPAASRAAVRNALAALERVSSLRQLPVEVWVDGQHLVRRLVLSFSETVSGQTTTASIALDIPQYGAQSIPGPPAADRVTDLSGLTSGL